MPSGDPEEGVRALFGFARSDREMAMSQDELQRVVDVFMVLSQRLLSEIETLTIERTTRNGYVGKLEELVHSGNAAVAELAELRRRQAVSQGEVDHVKEWAELMQKGLMKKITEQEALINTLQATVKALRFARAGR